VELQTVTVYARDWQATRRFYTEVVGLAIEHEQEGHFVVFATGRAKLCVDPLHGPSQVPTSAQLIFDVTDLGPYIERARSAGYDVEGPKLLPGGKTEVVDIDDPDGRQVRLTRATTTAK
jgi:predicted enzyme related to lactoylglutathione lyase